jgi:hypothetical protein
MRMYKKYYQVSVIPIILISKQQGMWRNPIHVPLILFLLFFRWAMMSPFHERDSSQIGEYPNYITIWPAILGKGQPSHQILIPKLPRKSRQHFIAHHFPRAHKSQTGVCTSSAVLASVTRCLSVSYISQCHMKWSTVSLSLCVIGRYNDQTLFSTQWK